MEKNIIDIIILVETVLLVFFSVLTLFMFLVIGKIHRRDPFLKQGFFNIVFTIIILEIVLRIILIISPVLIYLLKDAKINLIIYSSFNFFYITTIFFNFITVFYLYTHLDKSEDLISKDINDKTAHRDSIRVNTISFNLFYIISFLLGLIHTGFFIFFEFLKSQYIQNDIFFPIKQIEQNNFFFFFELIIYIPNFIFFIISFLYLKLSWNKEKITENIIIRSYAIYCFQLSILSLNYPIIILIMIFELFKEYLKIIILISNSLLIFQIFISAYFRINCLYIESIFDKESTNLFSKIKKTFIILFTNEKVERLSSLDYNNSFISFSLSSKKDFIIENNTKQNEIEESFRN